jgi:hypothetical protein
VARQLEEAIEMVWKPFPGLFEENLLLRPPYPLSPPSPEYRRKNETEEEKDIKARIREQWVAKEERPLRPNRHRYRGFSTEDALANDLVDEIEDMMGPTLKVGARSSAQWPVFGKSAARGEKGVRSSMAVDSKQTDKGEMNEKNTPARDKAPNRRKSSKMKENDGGNDMRIVTTGLRVVRQEK